MQVQSTAGWCTGEVRDSGIVQKTRSCRTKEQVTELSFFVAPSGWWRIVSALSGGPSAPSELAVDKACSRIDPTCDVQRVRESVLVLNVTDLHPPYCPALEQQHLRATCPAIPSTCKPANPSILQQRRSAILWEWGCLLGKEKRHLAYRLPLNTRDSRRLAPSLTELQGECRDLCLRRGGRRTSDFKQLRYHPCHHCLECTRQRL